MGAEFLVLLVLPALLAMAAGWDLASYTIPNVLPLAIFAAFFVFALLAGIPVAAVGSHLAAGLAGLAAGFLLFAAGVIGGGDAKLFAATALWFGFGDLGSYVLIASLFGGGLTLAIIVVRQFPLPLMLAGQPWLARLHDAKAGIPYGVALAAGALAVLPGSGIVHLLGAA